MKTVHLNPTGVDFRPDSRRVMLRSFIPSNPLGIDRIITRALALSERETETQLELVRADFTGRHINIDSMWRMHFEKVKPRIPEGTPLSDMRCLFIGALFSGEYALESAALFNPSIVPHPDQSGLGPDDLRFILSLRATGEGHISSIEFRTGVIYGDHSIQMEVPPPFVVLTSLNPNPTYHKATFHHKLNEMGLENDWSSAVMVTLGNSFTLGELDASIRAAPPHEFQHPSHEIQRTMECMHWLAESNYEIHFPATSSLSGRVISPVSPNESNGIEDARFVRFIDEDGTATYYATYTAYNGRVILPQLMETADFLNFRIRTLNGQAVQNKGMALFPRRINGRYAMLSRQDDENLFLMFSDNPHFWSDPQLLRQPEQPWELVKIGNCGSPIETEAGWLVITHGVGSMRKYCIGAILLDLNDPSRVIGRLEQPLVKPEGNGREGYVPNVVYSCGAFVYNGRLILPYGLSDSASTIVTCELGELLSVLRGV